MFLELGRRERVWADAAVENLADMVRSAATLSQLEGEPDQAGPTHTCRYNCDKSEHVGAGRRVCLNSDHWISCEQQARDILERMEIDGAQDFRAGELVEIANLISDKSEAGQ